MPNSPWLSPQRLLGGNRRIEDDPVSSRTRRQLNRIRNMTPRSRQRVAPVAPGSLRLDNDSSTHPVRAAERSIEACGRIPVGFEANSPTPPTPRNLEEGRHYEEEEPAPPSRQNESEETPDEVISETAVRMHVPIISEDSDIADKEIVIDLAPLMPTSYNKSPKKGDIHPSTAHETEWALRAALRKTRPWLTTIPSGLGMEELLAPPDEWIKKAGTSCPTFDGSRRDLREWAELPQRPCPGPEPKFSEDNYTGLAAMAVLRQKHKEWRSDRRDLTHYEA